MSLVVRTLLSKTKLKGFSFVLQRRPRVGGEAFHCHLHRCKWIKQGGQVGARCVPLSRKTDESGRFEPDQARPGQARPAAARPRVAIAISFAQRARTRRYRVAGQRGVGWREGLYLDGWVPDWPAIALRRFESSARSRAARPQPARRLKPRLEPTLQDGGATRRQAAPSRATSRQNRDTLRLPADGPGAAWRSSGSYKSPKNTAKAPQCTHTVGRAVPPPAFASPARRNVPQDGK